MDSFSGNITVRPIGRVPILILAMVLGTLLQAQLSPSTRFTVQDGLPSQNVYRVMQDSRGYIWVCTDQGLARFNGERFEVFTTKDGLPSNDVFNLTEDSQGRLWVHSFAKFFAYFSPTEERFLRIENPNSNSQGQLIGGYWEHSPDVMIVAIAFTAYQINLSKLTVNQMPIPGFLISSHTTVMKAEAYLSLTNPKGIQYENCYWEGECLSTNSISATFWGPKRVVIVDDSMRVLHFIDSKEARKVTYASLGFGANLKTKLFATPAGSDLLLLTDGRKELILDTFLNRRADLEMPEEYIKSFFEDRHENLWYALQDGGLHLVPRQARLGKTLLPGQNIITIAGSGANVWLATSQGEFFRLNNGGGTCRKVELVGAAPSYARKLLLVDTGLWACFDNQLLFIPMQLLSHQIIGFQPTFTVKLGDGKGKYSYKQTVIKAPWDGRSGLIFPSWKTVAKLNDGAVATPDSGRFIDGELYMRSIFEQFSFNDLVYAIQQDWAGRIWSGGGNGLSCWDSTGVELLRERRAQNPTLHHSVLDLAIDSVGSIWVATDGYGLWAIRPEMVLAPERASHVHHFLRDMRVNSIFVSERNEVWAATSEGGYLIPKSRDEGKVKRFVMQDGLPSDLVNAIYTHGDTAYFGTQAGLKALIYQKGTKESETPTLIVKAKLADAQMADTGAVRLEYDQGGELTIHFECLFFFRQGMPITYWFRLTQNGKVGKWQKTESTSLPLPLLDAGTYQLEVQAMNKSGMKTETVKRYFVVWPPWWKSSWFMGLLFLGFVALIWLVSAMRYRLLRQRAMRKALFAEQRLQALQAQMNPHFVSNILVAVQGLIAEDRGDEAREYLSKFSELNRQYLEASHHKWVTLKEELDMLENYLELEKLRFGDRFGFEIVALNEVLVATEQFPSRLLQPLAENAIHHGLAYLKHKGQLRIMVDRTDNGIMVIVDDDGIGRIASARLQEKRKLTHLSRGTALIQEILKTINSEGHMRFELKTTDKVSADGSSLGTRVEVCLVNLRRPKLKEL